MNSVSQISKAVLSNGLTVLVDTDNRFRSVGCAICLSGGLRSEALDEIGVSHALEHLLFKRTKKRSTKEIANLIDSLGGEVNAFTDADSLCLHGLVPNNRFEELLDFFAELLLETSFTAEDLALEKEVIRQEILESYDDPAEVVFQKFSESLWLDSTLGKPVFGDLESVASFEVEQLKERLQRLLCGRGITIAAAGAVSLEQVVSYAENNFSHLAAGKKESPGSPSIGCGLEIVPRPSGQVHVAFGKIWPELRHPAYLEGVLLASVLGDGMSSRLFQLLREDRGLVYDVAAEVDAYTDVAALVISAAFERSNVEPVLDLILGEIEKVRENFITEEEFSRAVSLQTARLYMEADDLSTRLWRAVETELIFGRYVSCSELIERYREMTFDHLFESLAAWFPQKKYLLVLGGDTENLEVRSQLKTYCEE